MSDVQIAIISGRSKENVHQMVGIPGITYAGNHGIDISLPNGIEFSYKISEDYRCKLKSLIIELSKHVCKNGAWIENKGSVITWHYHEVSDENREPLIDQAKNIFNASGIKIHYSYMAFEARPPIEWDKGYAALFIMDSIYGSNWSDTVSTIYIGDDRTDEDAFRALKGRSISFRVLRTTNVKTEATHTLPSCDAVLTLLKWIEKKMSFRIPQVIRSGNIEFKTNLFNNNNTDVFRNMHARAI